MIERTSLQAEKKYYNELSNYKYKCKCGHTVVILRDMDKRLCTWCHHFVYKNKKDEFKDRMRSVLNV